MRKFNLVGKVKPSEKYWWLNDESRTMLTRGYALEGEEVKDMVIRITTAAANKVGIEGLQPLFQECIERGWWSFSSPIWANMGAPRGLPISCYSVYFADNLPDILAKGTEVGMQMGLGGGTSGYYGALRARGEAITNNGKTNGPISFMKRQNTDVDVISQGGIRRGAFAAYLDIDHPDIKEFLTIKDIGSDIQNLFTGVCISDKWMEEMEAGDREKRSLWAKVLESRQQKGLPYLFFSDNVNRQAPEVYKIKNKTVWGSNLCITGDTRVVSDRGYLTARELYEQGGSLTLFNGEEEVPSTEMKLRGQNEDIYEVVLSNGMSMRSTDYHGYPVMDKEGNIKRVELKDLTLSDHIAVQTKKGLFGQEDMKDEAFLLGMYQGDGTGTDKLVSFDIWEGDFDLLNVVRDKVDNLYKKYGWNTYQVAAAKGTDKGYRQVNTPSFHDCIVREGSPAKKRLSSTPLKKFGFAKGVVPEWIWNSNEETQWEYVKGLLYTDGTVFKSTSKGEPVQLSYSSTDKEFLKELQKIFSNLGLQTSVRLLRKGGQALLPDGKGGEKLYETKDCFRLIVGNKKDCLEIEKRTGFLTRKGVILEDREYRDNTKKRYQIESISYVGKEDVFCPTVLNEEHIFVANGMRTYNCSEITLSTEEKESFICCLSSMNAALFDEWKDTDAPYLLTMFLDAVISDYIEKTEGMPFMETTRRFAMDQRAIGIGILGYHSYLQKNMIPFESFEAKAFNVEIFKLIQEQSKQASKDLGELLGYAPIFDGVEGIEKYRNVTTMAVAPTTSSSSILGQVSPGIEPFSSNYYKAGLAKGNFMRKNKELEKLLETKGKNTEEVWRSIMMSGGSVLHLDFLTDHEKNVFKTFKEISQVEILNQAVSRQRFIDQAQSLNLNIPADVPLKDVNRMIMDYWRNGGKTLYYQRSQSVAKELITNLVTCSSCEA